MATVPSREPEYQPENFGDDYWRTCTDWRSLSVIARRMGYTVDERESPGGACCVIYKRSDGSHDSCLQMDCEAAHRTAFRKLVIAAKRRAGGE